MSLKPISVQYASFISFVECDICGNRLSSSMIGSWPLCSSGKPHDKMSSEEQESNAK